MISVTEIILIVVGILALILGYLIPSGSGEAEFDTDYAQQKINEMVQRAIKSSKGQIDDMLDDCMEEAVNKAERAMDRVTNEKMSAISEYSDTVMNDIHKNHDEVVFMYDMLNDKHKNLKNTVSEATRAAQEVKQTAEAAVHTAEAAEAAAKGISESKGFKALSDMLDRADEAAAEMTRNRVIRSEYREETFEEPAGEVVSYKEPAYTENSFEEPSYKEDVFRETSYREPAFEEQVYAVSDSNEDIYEEESDNEQIIGINSEISEDDYDDDSEQSGGRVITPQPQALKPAETVQNRFAEINAPVHEEPVINEEPVAKVVSLAEASRKKSSERENAAAQAQNQNNNEHRNEGLSDPASRNQRILDMHKSGKSAVVIARELRLGIGEVKLVIDLAGKHKKNRSSIM